MSEIKPALTAEEWAVWLKDGARVPEMVDACYRDVFGGRAEDGSRHAQAAVALHEQPFGFTREDVEVLEGLVVALNRVGQLPSEPGLSEFYVPYCRSFADRIEALLPPEEK